MKRKRELLKKIFLILPFVLLLFGCAAPSGPMQIPMHTPVGELSQVDENHGIVIGSYLIKGPKPIFGNRPRSWLIAKDVSEIRDRDAKEYLLETAWLEEKIFLTKMPAGDYYFTAHRYSGSFAYIDQRFTVQPGKTVYIGHLTIAYYGRHLGAEMHYSFKVMDRREQTLAAAANKYGSLVSDAVTDLMGKIKIPQTFENVMYAPKEPFTLLSLPSGPLTIDKDALKFHSKKIQLTVPYDSILDVRWGKFGIHIIHEWVIIKFSADGSEKVAAFMSRDDRLEKEIYRTLIKTFEDFLASEGK